MRNVGLSKLQNLLFVLLLFALTGCGASNSNIAGPTGNQSGTITAKVVIDDGKSSAKSVAAPANVVSIRLRITGPYQIPGNTTTASRYTAVKATFPAAAGSASVAVTPGTGLTVIAEALDAGDTVLYEGIATTLNGSPINVVAGSTTDLKTITLKAPPVKEADKPCLSCHENSRDSNGNSLVANYKTSRHYNITTSPAAKYGVNSVGCAGCHGPAHNLTTYSDKTESPSTGGRCAECHTQATGFGPEQGVGSVSANHYALPNRYLDATKGNCSACHQPHNQAVGNAERVAWAESGHGNTAAPPWVPEGTHMWRVQGSTAAFNTSPAPNDCLRCHTSDGFKQFVTSGYTNVNNLPGDSTINTPLNCDACHTNNEFSVRTAPAFKTNYVANGGVGVAGVAGTTLVANNDFPDLGESNLCIPCHAGRGSQDVIMQLTDAQIANTSFKNGHYMPAAGIMFMKTGFVNFTSANAPAKAATSSAPALTYGGTYTLPLTKNAAGTAFVRGGVDAKYGGIIGGVTSAHRALGTQTILLAESWITDTATLNGNKGPCVTCHLNANTAGIPPVTTIAAAPFLPAGTVIPARRAGTGHSLSAVSADAAKQSCLPCHNDAQELNATNPALGAEEKLEEAKPSFLAGLAAITKLLDAKYDIKFDNATYAYFFEKTTGKGVMDWTRGGKLSPASARKLHGACYNLKMMSADEGAYVHGRTYVTRLIFDTIDFLDDGVMNKSAATYLQSFNPTLFPATSSWLYGANGARK